MRTTLSAVFALLSTAAILSLSACEWTQFNKDAAAGDKTLPKIENHAPIATPQLINLIHNADTSITLFAADEEDDTLTFLVVDEPLHGTLSGIAPELFYTPANGFRGSDSFSFKANDGLIDSDRQIITLNYSNHTPEAEAQPAVSCNEDNEIEITLLSSDTENDSLTYSIVDEPAHGSLSAINGTKVTYAPEPNYHGPDSFSFKVNDGVADSASAIVALAVDAINDAPVAVAITPAAFDEDTQSIITLAYSDVDGDQGTACTLSNLSHVSESHACACSLGICTVGVTSTANYNGSASFSYSITAGGQTTNAAAATLTVAAVNDAPTVPQSITCASPLELTSGNTCSITPANILDLEGDSVTYVLDNASTCSAAMVTSAATGAASFTAPAKNVSCTVKIMAYDGVAYSIAATSTITGVGWVQTGALNTGVWVSDVEPGTLAASSNGLNLIAVGSDDKVYTSLNGGTNWILNASLPALNHWYCVASDSSGSKLMAVSYDPSMASDPSAPGTAYLSENGSNSVSTFASSSGSGDWNDEGCASSPDGTKLIDWAGNSDGGSSYNGSTWTYYGRSATVPGALNVVHYLNNGGMVAGFYWWDHKVSYSLDNGASWILTDPSGSNNLNLIAMASSALSTRLIVAAGASTYTGVYSAGSWTWTQRTVTGSIGFSAVASSSDGSRLVGVEYGGYIFVSSDYGATWTKTTSSNAGAGRNWTNVVSSYDGKRITASATDGTISTLTLP